MQQGDEVSLGHCGSTDEHDVRYIFRSVGCRGARLGMNASKGGIDRVGEVYERYQIREYLKGNPLI
jgi:serine/threonine/tyrosine protein kinase RAD53